MVRIQNDETINALDDNEKHEDTGPLGLLGFASPQPKARYLGNYPTVSYEIKRLYQVMRTTCTTIVHVGAPRVNYPTLL